MHTCSKYNSAYATGLLVARRALTKLGLADKYEGVAEPDGELTLTETLDEEDAPRPFKAYLDVGLKRTSTGSRVFGALKGASDGGIYIPHNEKRFPGYDPEAKELDAEVLKKYIYGGHVAEYMESLEEEDDERYIWSDNPREYALSFSSGSRSNSRHTSLMVLALRIWRRFSPTLTPLFGKTPHSSQQKRRRTGRPRLSSTRPTGLPSPSARSVSPRRLPSSRLLATTSNLLLLFVCFMYRMPFHCRL